MDIESERAYPTPVANSTLLPLLLLSLATQKHTPECTNQFNGEYDYVIVGAGSAGSVVAGRLSEMPCVSVLIVEAGPPPPRLTEVPAFGRSFLSTNIDWAYRTTPQRYTGDALVNRQVLWPSGKALGGTSVINGLINVRGNRKNYDDWAEQGAVGWSYEDVLPYFMKLEDNQDPDFVANGYHGTGGPVTIAQSKYSAEMEGPIAQAALELGYRFVDPNGPTQTGFYDQQSAVREGQRCSTAKAYLVPAENRSNLDILSDAMVTKVVIENNTAVGIHLDHNGLTYEVRARREVILSAGTTNTAQLLMLSGIGPRSELAKFNIPVVADLPVGLNLQDHCCTFQSFLLNDRIQSFADKLSNPNNIEAYIANRTGPLLSNEGISLVAFLNNYDYVFTPDVDFPDHQLYFIESASIGARSATGLRPEVYEQVYGPYEGRPFYWCISQILHPKSRGTVRLQSANPYDPPLINPNYFEDPRDIEDVVQGMKTCQRIGTSQPMLMSGSCPFNTLYPGCEHLSEDEDQYFRCQARSAVLTGNHQVGTAKMGDPRDPTTVVDPKLRVKQVMGLRIVDASVMPIVPSGNTYIPTIMLAEKASDIIKETIRCQTSGGYFD